MKDKTLGLFYATLIIAALAILAAGIVAVIIYLAMDLIKNSPIPLSRFTSLIIITVSWYIIKKSLMRFGINAKPIMLTLNLMAGALMVAYVLGAGAHLLGNV